MQSTGQSTKPTPLRTIFGFLIPLLFGVFPFLRALGDSHTQAIRGLDMFRLVAAGFCWGIAFSGGLLWLTGSKVRKR